MAQEAMRRQLTRRTKSVEVTPVSFDMVDENGEDAGTETFHFTRPTEEQLFLMAAGVGGDDANPADEAAAIMSMLRQSLPPKEFRRLRERMADPEDGIDMEVLSEVIYDLVEVWSTFPTKQPSVSSGSQASSGGSSTGRVRGPGSTRSTSRSNAS